MSPEPRRPEPKGKRECEYVGSLDPGHVCAARMRARRAGRMHACYGWVRGGLVGWHVRSLPHALTEQSLNTNARVGENLIGW